MARWRLTEPHYLYTDPDTVWERIETDTVTGRQIRKQYVVPAYFHHEIEADWTDKNEKAVIVSDGHNPGKGDIIFKGEPTPGMRAMDDEAEKISEKFRERWNIPDNIKWGDGQYSGALTDYFTQQQDKLAREVGQLASDNARSLDVFMKQSGLQQSQMVELLKILANKSSGEPNAPGPTEPDNQRPATAVAAGRRRF